MVLVSLAPKTNPSWKESGFAAWSQWFRWVYTGNDLIMANHNVTPHNAYLDLTYCLLLSSLISVPLTFPENKQVHIREKWHTQLQASPAVQAGAPILQADTTSSSTARMSPVAHEGALNLRPFIEETPQIRNGCVFDGVMPNVSCVVPTIIEELYQWSFAGARGVSHLLAQDLRAV